MSAKKITKKEIEVSSNKNTSLSSALDQIHKAFGEGAIMKMTDASALKVDSIPTGSLSLDLALGVGGIPRGRIIEIYGPESSGKTTLSISMIASAQAKGGLAAFIDAEHAFDPDYAKAIGVNLDELLISQPDSGEQALEIVETLVRSNALDVIVIDSVAALVPRAELEGEMGDSQMGAQARLMSQALRKLTGVVSKSKSVVIFINQLRMKIGVMFGNPETTTGGMALKFYSSVRIDVRRIEQIKHADAVVGSRVRAKIVKNKVAPPFRLAEFDIIYAKGISKEGDILDLAVKYAIVERSGAWYIYNEDKLGQGKESARKFLVKNPELTEKFKEMIIEADKQKMAQDRDDEEE